MTTNVNEREALLVLNSDFRALAQRFNEAAEQLRRGGQRFAKIDLQMQAIEAAINGLRTDDSRAMALAERATAQAQDADRVVGAALRLANKVQQDSAALATELRQDTTAIQGDIAAIRAGLARLTTIVYGVGAAIGAIELARFVLTRRKVNA